MGKYLEIKISIYHNLSKSFNHLFKKCLIKVIWQKKNLHEKPNSGTVLSQSCEHLSPSFSLKRRMKVVSLEREEKRPRGGGECVVRAALFIPSSPISHKNTFIILAESHTKFKRTTLSLYIHWIIQVFKNKNPFYFYPFPSFFFFLFEINMRIYKSIIWHIYMVACDVGYVTDFYGCMWC